MSELLAEFLRGLLLALANPALVNDDVMFIGDAINFNSTELKFAKLQGRISASPRFYPLAPGSTRRRVYPGAC
jgi:hypothetical protein